METKRINLCFNVSDAKQKLVYEYLASLGRAKTTTVVDVFLEHAISQKKSAEEKNKENENLQTSISKILKEHNGSNEDIIEIKNKLDELLKKIDSIQIVPKTEEKTGGQILSSGNFDKDGTRSNPPATGGEEEMSEEMFSAMMSWVE